jgi:hypothetical protein
MPTVLIPINAKLGEGFTERQKAEAMVHPGRRTDGTQSGASWICDLMDTKKTILLCSYCREKFNHRKLHYRKLYIADPTGHTDGYAANGMCDHCKVMTVNAGGGTAFIHEEFYNQVCQDPVDARRKARAAAKAMSVWRAIQRS